MKWLGALDGFGGPVEEMNEKHVMTAICQIEQKLLLEDNSPSIHDSLVEDTPIQHTNVCVFPFYLP